MRGKGHKRLATRAFQQWRRLNFSVLCDQHMPTPHHATVRLPVHARIVATPAAPAPPTITVPTMELQLATNSPAVLEWWQHEFDPFLSTAGTPAEGPLLATARVSVHVGPPAQPLGYPPYIALEAQQYTEGVLRGETHAYEVGGAPRPSSEPYLPPVRWIQQPLVDGIVAQRLTAHTGVTTAALIDARHTALTMGRQLPPYAASPFYTVNELQDCWGLFGDADALVPPPSAGAASASDAGDVAQHHARVAELALGAALLTNYRAAWLNAAVLSCSETGRAVLVVGPRRSGKTTLALHCLAADTAGVQLTAAEHAFIAAGSPVRRMMHTDADAPPPSSSSPALFTCGVPHHVTVGLGAVLGTLRPNPALAAAAGELPPLLRTPAGLRAFLQNSDAVLWDMSQCSRVAVPRMGGKWAPAVVHQLAGVVLLGWGREELRSRAPVPVRTAVRAAPLHAGGLDELLARGRDYMFHGHQLLGATYDGAVDGPGRLADVLHTEWAETRPGTDNRTAPALHSIEGSVNFDLATGLVLDLLRGTR